LETVSLNLKRFGVNQSTHLENKYSNKTTSVLSSAYLASHIYSALIISCIRSPYI
uniref:Uncharacterized protein n=1 Tax=Aegilops tauschii subsp. strangulata TaxID=200361 RepID=A0A453IMS8_AEGTS